jgi:hypothetical protein
MEASMHGSLEKPDKAEQNIYGSWGLRLLAIPALLLTALIGFLVSHPAASSWISQAVQAELVGADWTPDLVRTQTAKPDMEIRTVKAY